MLGRKQLRSLFLDSLSRALTGLLAFRPAMPADNVAPPYVDLGKPGPQPNYQGTIFITARFRTGSTLLWNIFRHVDDCVSFYEPLNERRWFDEARRGVRVDQTHKGIAEYWYEYRELGDLGQWFREEWNDRLLLMDEGAWDPALRRYFDGLIHHAAPKRAVLQENRIDFRLPWFRRQFPGAFLVHLFRHPRDQWCSTLMKPGEVPRDVTMANFGPFDHYYLKLWAKDLQRHFPFLQAETVPYRAFYLIWRLSYVFGVSWCDYSLSFEDLIRSPQREIENLMSAVGLNADASALASLVSPAPIGQWQRHADDAWFSGHESACEDILEQYLRGQSVSTGSGWEKGVPDGRTGDAKNESG
jgi:hypothetical protein